MTEADKQASINTRLECVQKALNHVAIMTPVSGPRPEQDVVALAEKIYAFVSGSPLGTDAPAA